mgnify:CR=1 FL=1
MAREEPIRASSFFSRPSTSRPFSTWLTTPVSSPTRSLLPRRPVTGEPPMGRVGAATATPTRVMRTEAEKRILIWFGGKRSVVSCKKDM